MKTPEKEGKGLASVDRRECSSYCGGRWWTPSSQLAACVFKSSQVMILWIGLGLRNIALDMWRMEEFQVMTESICDCGSEWLECSRGRSCGQKEPQGLHIGCTAHLDVLVAQCAGRKCHGKRPGEPVLCEK